MSLVSEGSEDTFLRGLGSLSVMSCTNMVASEDRQQRLAMSGRKESLH